MNALTCSMMYFYVVCALMCDTVEIGPPDRSSWRLKTKGNIIREA
jgi:hypothetical protein